jgi:putative transposase
MVKNHKLGKSISDAGGKLFFDWLKYYKEVFGKIVIDIATEYTSQKCSAFGEIVKKTFSQRTHICQCGCILERDHNRALNILAEGLALLGRGGQCRTPRVKRGNAFRECHLYGISDRLLRKLACAQEEPRTVPARVGVGRISE